MNDNNNLNLNYILNNIRKKNNSFTNKNHYIPNNNVKRFNTESNEIPKQKKKLILKIILPLILF